QSSGLHNELKNLGLQNKSVNFYAEQVDSIASQVGIDLDQINLSWIRRFLPVTAVIIGMRYNSQLIDEVIGVAQATFAPEAKLANRAITDDSSSEAEVSKPASDDKQQDTEKKDTEKQDTEKNAKKESGEDTDSKKESAKGNDKEVAEQTEKVSDKKDAKKGSADKAADKQSK